MRIKINPYISKIFKFNSQSTKGKYDIKLLKFSRLTFKS